MTLDIKAFEKEVKTVGKNHNCDVLFILIREGKEARSTFPINGFAEVSAHMGIVAAKDPKVAGVLLHAINHYFGIIDKDDTEKAQEFFSQWCLYNPIVKKLYFATLKNHIEQAMKDPDKTLH
jgi:hypothetical protein